MSAPKQTLSQLVLALSGNTMAKRAEKYQWLFPFQEDSWESPGRVKNAWVTLCMCMCVTLSH